MNNPDIQSHLEALHGAWCRAASQDLSLRATERLFWELHNLDFTPSDVTLVVEHLLKLNKRSDGMKFSLRANKVLEPESFASNLAEAKATKRNARPAPSEKDKVISLLRPQTDPEQASTIGARDTTKTFADVIKNMGNG